MLYLLNSSVNIKNKLFELLFVQHEKVRETDILFLRNLGVLVESDILYQ